MYCKYRLYCALIGKIPGPRVGVEYHSSPLKSSMSYVSFENGLADTGGARLIDLWLCCEAYSLGVKQQWACLHTIRSKCSSIPSLSERV